MLTRRDFRNYQEWLAYVQESDRINDGMRPVDRVNASAVFADSDSARDIEYYWHNIFSSDWEADDIYWFADVPLGPDY